MIKVTLDSFKMESSLNAPSTSKKLCLHCKMHGPPTNQCSNCLYIECLLECRLCKTLIIKALLDPNKNINNFICEACNLNIMHGSFQKVYDDILPLQPRFKRVFGRVEQDMYCCSRPVKKIYLDC